MGDDEETRATRSLAGLAVALALVVLGLFLTLKLTEAARLEDCFLSGRRDCARISSVASEW
ncbi:MAG: hypothetical protein WCC64_03115 [Aliidongia sp.]|jgi:hypothetical protein